MPGVKNAKERPQALLTTARAGFGTISYIRQSFLKKKKSRTPSEGCPRAGGDASEEDWVKMVVGNFEERSLSQLTTSGLTVLLQRPSLKPKDAIATVWHVEWEAWPLFGSHTQDPRSSNDGRGVEARSPQKDRQTDTAAPGVGSKHASHMMAARSGRAGATPAASAGTQRSALSAVPRTGGAPASKPPSAARSSGPSSSSSPSHSAHRSGATRSLRGNGVTPRPGARKRARSAARERQRAARGRGQTGRTKRVLCAARNRVQASYRACQIG
jgi:hypothetical protein